VPSQPIISNTSPLIKLAAVGQLQLLAELYGSVVIPNQVRAEYRAGATADDPDLDALSWLRVQAVSIDRDLLALPNLGAGEAAVLSLARRESAQLVILDDLAARRVAQARGLVVTGSFGVLVAAKQVGLLAAIAPLLDQMVSQGRRITPVLRAELLRLAGETEE
jgi:uncharacterized protein